MKYRKEFDAWWAPLTRQGDPLRRYDLTGDAFDGGYEAGKAAALRELGEELLRKYPGLGKRAEHE